MTGALPLKAPAVAETDGHGAAARGFAPAAAPSQAPLSGREREARGLVAVDHPDRSSIFHTIPVRPVYLHVEPLTAALPAARQLPIVAYDGRCYEQARFRHPADAARFLHLGEGACTLPAPVVQSYGRMRVDQRDLLLDPASELVTDDVASRFAAFLEEIGLDATITREAIRLLRERGLGMVDPNRHRSWIDERTYEGALFRAHQERHRADTAESAVARLASAMPPGEDEITGEYDT